jgi:Ni/Fe-hydrogenase b-type cytochrome subunit
MHWIAAVAVVVLIVTGFYVGKPYFMTSGEASDHFLMGWMRFLHFGAAAVLIATGIVRIYWLFAGNRFENWKALLPYHRRDWVNMWRVFIKYLLIYPERAPHYLGHNPLQQVSYTALYGLVLVQVATGFAMYGQSDPDGMFYALFHWIVPLLGGAQVVRFVHHVLTWVFVIFIPIHVYLTVRADALHHEGRISSMVSGGRFVRDDLDYVDE